MLKLKFRLLKDNKMLYVIMIAMSLVIASVFGNTFNSEYKPSIIVVDESNKTETADIIDAIETEGTYTVKLVDYEQGLQMIASREALMMLRFDTGIELYELKPSVESYQMERFIGETLSNKLAQEKYVDKVYRLITASSTGAVDKIIIAQQIDAKMDGYLAQKNVFHLTQSYFNADPFSNYDPKIHYTIGMTLFFVTYSLMFTVGDYLEDKRTKTLDRMLVSPVSRFEILSANIIPAFCIGAFQIALMILFGKYLFGIEWGNHLPVVISIGISYIFAMTALCFFIVSLVKNISQLGAISPIILTGMGMLGGCMWPLEIISSKLLLTIANFTPHHWAIVSIESILIQGEMTSEIYTAYVVLLLMGIVFIILGERVLNFKALKTN